MFHSENQSSSYSEFTAPQCTIEIMTLFDRLKLVRIAWEAANDPTGLLHAVVDGVRVQLKVHGQDKSPVATLFYGLSEIEIEELPARWSIPIGHEHREAKKRIS